MGNHYVPQKYLEGFCDPDGWIFQYEKGSTKPPVRTRVKRVAQERNFYSPELEKELNIEIEVPANRVLKQLRQGQMISSQDKFTLAEYISNMMKRTPKGWKKAKNATPQIVSDRMKIFEDDIRNQIKTYPQQRIELENLWAKVTESMEGWKNNPPREPWYYILHATKNSEIIKVLSSLVWSFYVAEEPLFLTSDNPVFYPEAIGIGKAVSEISFPISSTIALEATNLVSRGMIFYSANETIVQRINRRTIQNATRYIFHCKEDPSMLELINTKN